MTTATATRDCTTCGFRLDYAAVLCDSETCTTCELDRLTPTDEWVIFRAALRESARPDGTVHVNDVRPKVRGRIAPKHLGMLWRRSDAEGLTAFIPGPAGWEPSTDALGRNSDKQSRVRRWLGT